MENHWKVYTIHSNRAEVYLIKNLIANICDILTICAESVKLSIVNDFALEVTHVSRVETQTNSTPQVPNATKQQTRKEMVGGYK